MIPTRVTKIVCSVLLTAVGLCLALHVAAAETGTGPTKQSASQFSSGSSATRLSSVHIGSVSSLGSDSTPGITLENPHPASPPMREAAACFAVCTYQDSAKKRYISASGAGCDSACNAAAAKCRNNSSSGGCTKVGCSATDC